MMWNIIRTIFLVSERSGIHSGGDGVFYLFMVIYKYKYESEMGSGCGVGVVKIIYKQYFILRSSEIGNS